MAKPSNHFLQPHFWTSYRNMYSNGTLMWAYQKVHVFQKNNAARKLPPDWGILEWTIASLEHFFWEIILLGMHSETEIGLTDKYRNLKSAECYQTTTWLTKQQQQQQPSCRFWVLIVFWNGKRPGCFFWFFALKRKCVTPDWKPGVPLLIRSQLFQDKSWKSKSSAFLFCIKFWTAYLISMHREAKTSSLSSVRRGSKKRSVFLLDRQCMRDQIRRQIKRRFWVE